jgi:hypothetical protein
MAFPLDIEDFLREQDSGSTTGNSDTLPCAFTNCQIEDQFQDPSENYLKDSENPDFDNVDDIMIFSVPREEKAEAEKEPVFIVRNGRNPTPVPMNVEMPEEPAPLARRAIIRGNNPLVSFVKVPKTFKSSKIPKPPKHEYYLAMIIRACKKAVRIANACSSTIPSGGLFKHLYKNPEAVRKWANFEEYVLKHPELVPVAETKSGPATDGKSKRPTEEDSEFSSFNKKYIQHHFSSEAVRTAHYYFTEMVFEGNCDQLCESMKFKCHQRGTHTKECEKKWRELKTYTQDGMIREVGWEPFVPQ